MFWGVDLKSWYSDYNTSENFLSWSNICFWASGLLFMNLVWLHGEAGEMIQNLYPRCASAGRMNMDNLFFNSPQPFRVQRFFSLRPAFD